MNYHANSGTQWPADEALSLMELWRSGKTASEIAIQLNKRYANDRTRNAVIGKVHRLAGNGYDLNKRPSPIKRTAKREADHRADITIAPGQYEAVKAVRFCHEPNCFQLKERKDYCGYHAELYYEPRSKKPQPLKAQKCKF